MTSATTDTPTRRLAIRCRWHQLRHSQALKDFLEESAFWTALWTGFPLSSGDHEAFNRSRQTTRQRHGPNSARGARVTRGRRGWRLPWIPIATVVTAAAIAGASPAAAEPTTEAVYVAGRTYQINTGGAVMFDAAANLLQQASPMFLIGFPVAPGTTGPITLPSGYEPQANGLPVPVPYHDHVLEAAPGLGAAGAASVYEAPLRVVNLFYTWAYAYSPSFVPITSVDEIAVAEAGGELQPINPGAPDPYQVWTTTILVRPIVSPRA